MDAAGEAWQTILGWLIILLLWRWLAAASGRSRRRLPRDRRGKGASLQAPSELADQSGRVRKPVPAEAELAGGGMASAVGSQEKAPVRAQPAPDVLPPMAPGPPGQPSPDAAVAASRPGGRAGQLWSMAAAGMILSEILGPPRCRRPYRPPRAGAHRS